MTTVDRALGGRCPAMLKIDVEGFETEVLKGATASLNSTTLRVLIIELGGMGGYYGFDEETVYASMKGHGFEDCTYDPFERSLVPRGSERSSPNSIFVRDLDFVTRRVTTAPPFTVQGVSV